MIKTILHFIIFNKDIFENDIKNIETIYGAWPDVKIQTCDVIIAFYAAGISKGKESLIAMVNAVKRGGIITANGTLEDGSIYKNLADRLDVKPRNHGCNNGCYLRGSLKMLGYRVKR